MNVDSKEFLLNPYPFYAKQRERAPISKNSDYSWTVTGYPELSVLLAKSAAGRGNIGQIPRPGGDDSELDKLRHNNLALRVLERWMLFQNPPKHTRTRASIAEVFSNKMVNQLEERIRLTARKLLTRCQSQTQPFDLVQTAIYPFPLAVICELIGIPEKDRAKFAFWTRNLAMLVQADFHSLSQEKLDEFNRSAQALQDHIEALVPIKQEHQPDDLMTRFIVRNIDDLDTQDLLANCVFLLFAGHDSTNCLISNAMLALLNHPKQWQALQDDPDLLDPAVEECLRYDPSIQMVGRYALRDFEVGNHQIKQGEHIFCFLGAAGRDPRANDQPNQFNIRRQQINHLAFARGAHHCLGSILAKMEIRLFLEETVRLLPNLERAGMARRRPTWLMRGLDQMPVKFK